MFSQAKNERCSLLHTHNCIAHIELMKSRMNNSFIGKKPLRN
jgi:hypothetical protein